MKPKLMIVRCEDGPSDVGIYFMIETYLTSEGLRTRVCSGRWKTLEAAQEELRKRQALIDS